MGVTGLLPLAAPPTTCTFTARPSAAEAALLIALRASGTSNISSILVEADVRTTTPASSTFHSACSR